MSSQAGAAAPNAGRTHRQRSEVRDNMRIDWDVPIPMDDGIVLRADVFRPVERRPLSGHPHVRALRKGARLSGRLSDAWQRMADKHPDVDRGLEQPLSKLGSGGPGEMGAARLRLRARGFTRLRPLARICRSFFAA